MTLFDSESHCLNCGRDDGEHRSRCLHYVPPLPEDFDTLVAHTIVLWEVRQKMRKTIHNSLRSDQIRDIHRIFMDRLVELYEEEDRAHVSGEPIQLDLDMFLNRWGE